MNGFLLFLFMIVWIPFSQGQSISLSDLEGKWFINQSNFPMWTKGKKTNPTFNYKKAEADQKWVLMDEVQYNKKDKSKTIRGIDYPKNEENTTFVWRGHGILRLLKSKWEIIYYDNTNQYMIIHFRRTLFTPEGYDVVSRSKTLSGDLKSIITEKLKVYGIENLSIIKQE